MTLPKAFLTPLPDFPACSAAVLLAPGVPLDLAAAEAVMVRGLHHHRLELAAERAASASTCMIATSSC